MRQFFYDKVGVLANSDSKLARQIVIANTITLE